VRYLQVTNPFSSKGVHFVTKHSSLFFGPQLITNKTTRSLSVDVVLCIFGITVERTLGKEVGVEIPV
jgi:hypothetical protein